LTDLIMIAGLRIPVKPKTNDKRWSTSKEATKADQIEGGVGKWPKRKPQ